MIVVLVSKGKSELPLINKSKLMFGTVVKDKQMPCVVHCKDYIRTCNVLYFLCYFRSRRRGFVLFTLNKSACKLLQECLSLVNKILYFLSPTSR